MRRIDWARHKGNGCAQRLECRVPSHMASTRGNAKHPCVTVQTHHQRGICAVAFFNNETQGKWEKGEMNGLLQLDCSVCRSNMLQTPKHKDGKNGIQVWNHQDYPPQTPLCHCTRSVRGSSQPEKGGQLKHLCTVAASSNLCAI